MHGQPAQLRRLAAILSADAVGYTRLMADDEAATLATLNAHRKLLAEQVAQHGGRVVDAVGDNLLAEFPSAVDALRCALECQRQLVASNDALAPDRRMQFRIGINVGDVLVDGERIVGDGVNIAARVEATARPGGIALSGLAYDQVEGKLPIKTTEKEPQVLKNVSRPVRIFDVHDTSLEPATATTVRSRDAEGFADSHAIAVLPFRNLSQNIEQEYFADGLAEDLITSLAALRIYPVISRNSSFTYRGKAVDVRQVGKDLGALYVVTGSVRRSGDRVRVSAELVEATDAVQLWSGRFESQLADIFELQDELTEKIAAAVGPALSRSELRRAMKRPKRGVDAWDCVHRGMWHLAQFSKEGAAKAQEWARRALDLDPGSAKAYSLIAFGHLHQALFQWSDSAKASILAALEAGEKAVSLDDEDPVAPTALGFALSFAGEHERAISVLERAVRLNPSAGLAVWALGAAMATAGRPDEAIPLVERAIRLSPQDPLMFEFLFTISLAHFAAGRYDRAMALARQSLDLRPGQPGCYRVICAACGHLGCREEGARALEQLTLLLPEMTEEHLRTFMPDELADRYVEGLRLSGWQG